MYRLPDLLYPRRCALCDSILSAKEPFICRTCSGKVKFIRGRTCAQCGVVLKSRFETLCPECVDSRRLFNEAFAPFAYAGEIRTSIARFKYQGRAEYAAFYAACIFEYGQYKIRAWEAQAIVPVPVHRKRLVKRGYNQSLLIAKELSKLIGVPVNEKLLKRNKNTEAQKELTASARRKNLLSAFVPTDAANPPESVLIVDDIFTTGSTVNAMSYALRSIGVKRIYVACASVS